MPSNSDKGVVRSSLFVGNAAPYGGGMLFLGQSAGAITNCTIVGNIATEVNKGGGIYSASSGLSVNNSIIWGNFRKSGSTYPSDNLEFGDSAPSITYSCSSPLPDGEGNIDADPLFANAAEFDFTPRGASPVMGKGLPGDWMATALDLAGNPRILGDGVEMGALEGLCPPGLCCCYASKPPDSRRNIDSQAGLSISTKLIIYS